MEGWLKVQKTEGTDEMMLEIGKVVGSGWAIRPGQVVPCGPLRKERLIVGAKVNKTPPPTTTTKLTPYFRAHHVRRFPPTG